MPYFLLKDNSQDDQVFFGLLPYYCRQLRGRFFRYAIGVPYYQIKSKERKRP